MAMANEGRVEGRQVLASSLVSKLMTPRVQVPTDSFGDFQYGYGLFLHEYRGIRLMEHSGSMPGFQCDVWMVPEHRFGMVLLANREGVRLPQTLDRALELFLPVQSKAEPQMKPTLAMDAAEIALYTGKYSNRFEVELFERGGKLFLRLGPNEIPVSKVGENRFAFTRPRADPPDEFLLGLGPDGGDEYLQMFLWVFKRGP